MSKKGHDWVVDQLADLFRDDRRDDDSEDVPSPSPPSIMTDHCDVITPPIEFYLLVFHNTDTLT